MKPIKTILIVLSLIAIAAISYFTFFKAEPQPAYITETVKRGNVRQTVSATGEIVPSQLVDVGAQVTGQIKAMHVRLGQTVEKGQLIAEIDATTQLNNLNTNKARLEAYQAQLESARAALRTAKSQFDRETALLNENATSRHEWETARDNHAAARARLADIESSIRQTRIAINSAETDLGYTRITAPMSGTVVFVRVEAGQTINAAQNTPTIVQIADLSHMLNKMQIAEGDITKVRAGQALHFTTLADPETPRQGELTSIDPGLTTLSQGNYSTHSDTTNTAIYYYARALVDNADGKLAIGMTTQNEIVIQEAQNTLTVPSVAIKTREGKSHVRVLENGQAQERTVTTGISNGSQTEIKSGLNEGETVIVSEDTDSSNSSNRNRRPPRL